MKMCLVQSIGGQSIADRDLATVSSDAKGDLGKWVHGPKTGHVSMREYKTLAQPHAAVHKTAGAIVPSVQQQNPEQATIMLGNASIHSSKLAINAIRAMHGKFGA